jgi:V/A-type H+-transporting ATPase subunit I
MKVCFVLGAIHLVCAQLRQALARFPDQRFLANVGWSVFLAGMLLVILMMFRLMSGGRVVTAVSLGAILVGFLLAIGFTAPARNPLKRIAVGFASSLLPAIGTFSDTMSYIRLMAVGLASYYIAFAFNGLGAQLAGAATWFAAAPIIVFGHALNIGLAVIAIFAHGVRLNMLEFSNNAGVQWAGFAYKPFANSQTKES